MDRKEFLSAIGLSTGALVFASCLGGCNKSSTDSNSGNVTPAPSVDFTLDLTLAANAPLLSNGGYIYSNGVIVAKTTTGSFIAVSKACTHQGTDVQYTNTNQFYCPNHGAIFSASGGVVSGPVTTGLKSYSTALNGNMLRIFG